jgi:hypothetical protein
MVKWSNGQMVKWSNGQMVKWSNGQMVKWSNLDNHEYDYKTVLIKLILLQVLG